MEIVHRSRRMRDGIVNYRYISFATHRLRVERSPRNSPGHLYDRERVPFTTAYRRRVDVDVRPRIERVASENVTPRGGNEERLQVRYSGLFGVE